MFVIYPSGSGISATADDLPDLSTTENGEVMVYGQKPQQFCCWVNIKIIKQHLNHADLEKLHCRQKYMRSWERKATDTRRCKSVVAGRHLFASTKRQRTNMVSLVSKEN